MAEFPEDAACKDADLALFFPESKKRGGASDYRAARVICAACPVREACLEAAMLEESKHQGWRAGMRGGMSPAQRDQHARKVRWCWTCGTRFVPMSKERHCSEACRRAARVEATERWRENAA
jgi:WhiB family redox-sensing transcriptional regulator